MDFLDWEKEYYGHRGMRPLSERISEKNKVLGFVYGFAMQILTDPLTYISGEGIAASLAGKTGKAVKAEEFLKVTKAAKGGSTADNIIEGEADNVKHAVGNAKQAQSVLDGINPKYFNADSRFGGGFYVGGDDNTIKYAISYDMNLSGQKVLDLTNPEVASKWNFVPNNNYEKLQIKTHEGRLDHNSNTYGYQLYFWKYETNFF